MLLASCQDYVPFSHIGEIRNLEDRRRSRYQISMSCRCTTAQTSSAHEELDSFRFSQISIHKLEKQQGTAGLSILVVAPGNNNAILISPPAFLSSQELARSEDFYCNTSSRSPVVVQYESESIGLYKKAFSRELHLCLLLMAASSSLEWPCQGLLQKRKSPKGGTLVQRYCVFCGPLFLEYELKEHFDNGLPPKVESELIGVAPWEGGLAGR
jgi:hypothetical protein